MHMTHKWTAKYLASNEDVRSAADALLELAFLPPHPSLHAGKVSMFMTMTMRSRLFWLYALSFLCQILS